MFHYEPHKIMDISRSKEDYSIRLSITNGSNHSNFALQANLQVHSFVFNDKRETASEGQCSQRFFMVINYYLLYDGTFRYHK